MRALSQAKRCHSRPCDIKYSSSIALDTASEPPSVRAAAGYGPRTPNHVGARVDHLAVQSPSAQVPKKTINGDAAAAVRAAGFAVFVVHEDQVDMDNTVNSAPPSLPHASHSKSCGRPASPMRRGVVGHSLPAPALEPPVPHSQFRERSNSERLLPAPRGRLHRAQSESAEHVCASDAAHWLDVALHRRWRLPVPLEALRANVLLSRQCLPGAPALQTPIHPHHRRWPSPIAIRPAMIVARSETTPAVRPTTRAFRANLAGL